MTANISEVLSKVPTGLLINGEWVDAQDGETFDVENPATGEVIATLASAGEADAKAALDAACAVQEEWAATQLASALTSCAVPSIWFTSVQKPSLR